MRWLLKILLFEDVGADTVVNAFPKLPNLDGWRWIVFAAVAVAAFVLARHLYLKVEPHYVDARRKRFLLALRMTAIALVLFMCTGAYFELRRQTESRGTVALLFDRSASMGVCEPRFAPADVADAARTLGLNAAALTPEDRQHINATPRIGFVRAALDPSRSKTLKNLSARFDIKAFAFGQSAGVDAIHMDPAAADPLAGLGPTDEPATRLGDAILDLARRMRGQHLDAVIALTDGAVNRGEDPVKAARDLGAPVYTIGVGLTETRDVQLVLAVMEDVIFRGDEFPINLRLRQHGFGGRETRIVVRRNGEVVHTEKAVIADSVESTRVLKVKADKAGEFAYEVEVEPLPGEASEKNNVKRRHRVRIVDEPVKVLLVDDTPRWEWRFLKATLESDRQRMRPTYVLRSADPRVVQQSSEMIAKFPASEDDLRKYDVLVLGNMPSSFFTRQELACVERYVRVDGRWLIVVAGRPHMPASYVGTPLADLLPVEVVPQSTAGPQAGRFAATGARPAVTQAGMMSPLLQLDADADANKRLWQQLPAIYWLYESPAAKPGAEVLMELPADGDTAIPLIARQRYGAGQVLFVGTDETWRWRQLPRGEHHRQVWNQMITQMGLDHLLGSTDRVQIDTETPDAALGSDMAVVVRMTGPDLKPLKAENVTLVAESDDGRKHKVSLAAEKQPGVFSGKWTPAALGRFRLYVEDHEDEGERAIAVTPPQIEFDEPAMRADVLSAMSAATGGAYLPLARIGEVEGLLAKIPPLVRVQQQERPLWNSPILLLCVALVLGLEWLMRKRWDLL